MTSARRKRVLAAILAVAVSGALVTVLLSRVDGEPAWRRLSSARIGLVGLGFFSAAILLCLRALRWGVVMPGVAAATMVSDTALHNFFLRVMPLRLGELSLPYLLAASSGLPAVRTLIALALVRILDMVIFLVLALGAIAATFGGTGLQRAWLAVPAMLVLAGIAATFAFWVRLGHRGIAAAAAATHLDRTRPVKSLLDQMGAAITENTRLSGRRRILLALTTVAIAVFQIATFAVLLRAFSIDLPAARMVVGVSMAIGFGSLPLPTIGNIGTHETGWTFGFAAVGVPVADAVVTGLATGLITLGFSLVFALPSALLHTRAVNRMRDRARDDGTT